MIRLLFARLPRHRSGHLSSYWFLSLTMAAPTSPVPFSLAEGSDPHEPFTPGALGLNTPAKRAQTSEIWTKKMAMRIRGETGRAQALRTQGYTHVLGCSVAYGIYSIGGCYTCHIVYYAISTTLCPRCKFILNYHKKEHGTAGAHSRCKFIWYLNSHSF